MSTMIIKKIIHVKMKKYAKNILQSKYFDNKNYNIRSNKYNQMITY